MSSTIPEYPPDYVNYDDGPRVTGAMTAVITLATIFVALRFGVRLKLRARLALDDWVALTSLVVAWAEYVDGLLCIKYGGVGLHLPIALERKPAALRYTFIYMLAGELLFFTDLALIKWSILAMYYRIFPTRFMKWGYAVLGSMTAAWWASIMLAAVFQCTPIHKYWDLDTQGSCINANTFYISTNGVPNIVMDAMILCLPIREVYKLHVSRKLKLAIGANFLVGSIVIIASIIKLCVMIQLYQMGSDADVTYYLADLIIWVVVEPCMGIISATLPTLRPVLTFLLHQVGLSQNMSDRASTPGRPSLITFGRGNVQKKRGGYNTTASIDEDHNSLEGLSRWPGNDHGRTTAASGVKKGGAMKLADYAPGSQQHISVRTEMEWSESHQN